MTPNGFDRLARPYRWMEYFTFGPLLQRCRTRFLPQMATVRNALVLGDGDGRFTARLLYAAPATRVTAIDASNAMLTQLRNNCRANAGRVVTYQAMLPDEWNEIPGGQTYDLVATHFFLDCLTTGQVEQLARRIGPHLQENALWVISDFAVPHGLLRLPSALIVAALYRAFRILTGLRTQHLPRHEDALHAAGFERVKKATQFGGLLKSELWRHAEDAHHKIKTER